MISLSIELYGILPYQMICSVDINSSRVPVSYVGMSVCGVTLVLKMVQELIDTRSRIPIFSCHIVEHTVIKTHAKLAVLLWGE